MGQRGDEDVLQEGKGGGKGVDARLSMPVPILNLTPSFMMPSASPIVYLRIERGWRAGERRSEGKEGGG